MVVTRQSIRNGGRGRAAGEQQGHRADNARDGDERSLTEVGKEMISKTLSKDSEAFVESSRQHDGE